MEKIIEIWSKSLDKYYSALYDYFKFIEEELNAEKETITKKKLDEIKQDLAEPLPDAIPANIPELFIKLEEIRAKMNTLRGDILDFRLINAAMKKISLSSGEYVHATVRRITKYSQLMTTRVIIYAERIAEEVKDKITTLKLDNRMGLPGTILYARLLRHMSTERDISDMLRDSLNEIFNIHETPETIQRDYFAGLHPIESMGIVFSSCERKEQDSSEKQNSSEIHPIMFNYKDSSGEYPPYVIKYDVNEILSKKGDISRYSGLNYKIVKKFSSIARDYPFARHIQTAEPSRTAGIQCRNLYFTIDGEHVETVKYNKPANNIMSGPKPRITAINKLIMDAINESDGPLKLLPPPEEMQISKDIYYTSEELKNSLINKFGEEYETLTINNESDLLYAFLGNLRNRNIYKSYIVKAINFVMIRTIDRKLMEMDFQKGGGGNLIFGTGKNPADYANQELIMENITEIGSTYTIIAKRIRKVYDRKIKQVKYMFKQLREEPDKEIRFFKKKRAILELYANLIDEVFKSKVVEKMGTIERKDSRKDTLFRFNI